MVQPRPSRFKSDIRIKPGKAKKVEPETRMCEAPDCIRAGDCRVAKSPKNLTEYFWYCAAHARAHVQSSAHVLRRCGAHTAQAGAPPRGVAEHRCTLNAAAAHCAQGCCLCEL